MTFPINFKPKNAVVLRQGNKKIRNKEEFLFKDIYNINEE